MLKLRYIGIYCFKFSVLLLARKLKREKAILILHVLFFMLHQTTTTTNKKLKTFIF